MVFRYLEGQVYCVKCGYMNGIDTWKDVSGHPRCNQCSSRVRTRPRSSRLKTLMRDELDLRETIRINNEKTHVYGTPMVIHTVPKEVRI